MTPTKKAKGTAVERTVRLIVKLLNSRQRIDYTLFADEEWGTYGTNRNLLQKINDAWALHSGNPLFDQVNEDGQPWSKGQPRFLRLADNSMKGATATNLAIMPVFLQFLKMLKGTYLEKDFLTLYGNTTSELKDGEKNFLKSTSKKFFYATKGIKDYSKHSERIETLYKAVLSENLVSVQRIRKDKSEVTSKLAPLTVVLFNNGLYVIALDTEHTDAVPLLFKIENFKSVRMLPNKFTHPVGYSPESVLKNAFGLHHEPGVEHTVEIELLDNEIVDYVKTRRWTNNDEYFTANGNTCLRFKTSSLVEVTSWVLSFGPLVRVIGPADLLKDVSDSASKLHTLYAAKTRHSA